MHACCAHLVVKGVVYVHESWLAAVAGEGEARLAISAGVAAGQIDGNGSGAAPSRRERAGGGTGAGCARLPIGA
jgi:hypothetical protein